jgi:hypothetical protein
MIPKLIGKCPSQVPTEGEMSDARLWRPNSSMVSIFFYFSLLRQSHSHHYDIFFRFIDAAAADPSITQPSRKLWKMKAGRFTLS